MGLIVARSGWRPPKLLAAGSTAAAAGSAPAAAQRLHAPLPARPFKLVSIADDLMEFDLMEIDLQHVSCQRRRPAKASIKASTSQQNAVPNVTLVPTGKQHKEAITPRVELNTAPSAAPVVSAQRVEATLVISPAASPIEAAAAASSPPIEEYSERLAAPSAAEAAAAAPSCRTEVAEPSATAPPAEAAATAPSPSIEAAEPLAAPAEASAAQAPTVIYSPPPPSSAQSSAPPSAVPMLPSSSVTSLCYEVVRADAPGSEAATSAQEVLPPEAAPAAQEGRRRVRWGAGVISPEHTREAMHKRARSMNIPIPWQEPIRLVRLRQGGDVSEHVLDWKAIADVGRDPWAPLHTSRRKVAR